MGIKKIGETSKLATSVDLTKPAIKIKDISVSYGKTQALQHISLSVNEKDYLGIMGPNGGGKSTLLRTILGFIKPDNGIAEVFGCSCAKNREILGYVPQFSSVDKNFPISVQKVVETGLLKGRAHPFHTYSNEQKEQAMQQLERLGIADLANRQISELSGGEFQRLLIARSLAANPKILLLDEPTASVDPSSREKIYSLLAELNKEMTIVLVTHDLTAISSSIKKLACLNQTLVYHGEPVLTDEVVEAMYGCPVDLIAHGVPHRVLADSAHQCVHGIGDNCPVCNGDSKHV
ncbi:MAG: ABC transporter [Treponema sp. CETP13]|nr:MAG: ABC transporter [Treponema sp. CETP13]